MFDREISLSYQSLPNRGLKRNKYEIIEARLAELKRHVADLEESLAWMDKTPFIGSACDCGHEFTTEADFAKHFYVTDERYINLGNCPILDSNKED